MHNVFISPLTHSIIYVGRRKIIFVLLSFQTHSVLETSIKQLLDLPHGVVKFMHDLTKFMLWFIFVDTMIIDRLL